MSASFFTKGGEVPQIDTQDVVARLRADRYRKFRSCKQCGLFNHCLSPFMKGVGPRNAKVMVIGEAPGFDEDQQDVPFVGKAGSFLRHSLKAVGISEKSVYFTNAVSCRPPNNDIKFQAKAPTFCKGGLWQEIQDVDPDIVVLAGNIPMKSVLGIEKITHWSGTPIPTSKVPSLHVKAFDFPDSRERIYFPLLHPSYVLRCRHTEIEEVTLGRFTRDMQNLKKLVDGEVVETGTKLPPHRVIGWDAMMLLRPTEDTNTGARAKSFIDEANEEYAKFERLRDKAFKEACKYLDDLHKYPRVGYDYETPDLDQYQEYSRVLCVSFAPLLAKPGVKEKGKEYPWTLPKEGVCIPVDHPDSPFSAEQREVIKEKIRAFLRNPKIRKVAWNHVFEYIVGALILGVEPEGLVEDPMYEVFTTNEMPGTHGLKYNVRVWTEYGGYERENEKAVAASGGNFANIPGRIVFPYNGMDSYAMMAAEAAFYHRIGEDNQWPLLDKILTPAVRLLARMEIEGIRVDQEKVRQLTEDFDRWIAGIVKTVSEMPEVERAEYKVRKALSLKRGEAEREKRFDEAVAEAKERKAELDALAPIENLQTTVTNLQARIAKIQAHLAKHQGQKLPKARQLLKEAREALREVGPSYRKLLADRRVATRRAEVAVRKAERARAAFSKVVDRINAECTFSLSKDEHVKTLLYDILRFPIIKLTPTGEPSTDDEVIEKYAKRHEAVRLLHAYRKLTKIRSTYLLALHPDPDVHQGRSVVKPDGKIHPNVKALARTGRLMSGSKGRGKSEEASKKFKFNIQNLPRPVQLIGAWLLDKDGNAIAHCCPEHEKELGHPKVNCGKCGVWISIRDCLVTSFICEEHNPRPKKGCMKCGRIVESDYSGLEAMTLGILAQDESVLKLVKTQVELEPLRTEIEDLQIQAALGVAPEGWEARVKVLEAEIGPRADYADFHKLTASLIYDKKPEFVTKDERQDSKSIAGFGLLYGRAAPALAADMNWTIPHAEMIVDKFWQGYRGIQRRNEYEKDFARRHGYVETICWQRRRLPAINSPDRGKRGHAEREAVNVGIQGPCSHFNLIAATLFDRQARKREWKARVIALVHDAIYINCPHDEALEVARLLKKIQEFVPTTFKQMVAPLRVERKVSVTMGKG